MCLGASLAMLILKSTLPTLLQQFKLTVVPNSEVSGKIVSTMLGPTTSVIMRIDRQDGRFECHPLPGRYSRYGRSSRSQNDPASGMKNLTHVGAVRMLTTVSSRVQLFEIPALCRNRRPRFRHKNFSTFKRIGRSRGNDREFQTPSPTSVCCVVVIIGCREPLVRPWNCINGGKDFGIETVPTPAFDIRQDVVRIKAVGGVAPILLIALRRFPVAVIAFTW